VKPPLGPTPAGSSPGRVERAAGPEATPAAGQDGGDHHREFMGGCAKKASTHPTTASAHGRVPEGFTDER